MRVAYLALVCGVTLAASGCGGTVTDAGGKVVSGGNQYTLADGEGIMINLTSEDGKTASAQVEKDGTFKLRSPGSDSGVPPGKYKVGYTHYPPAAGGKGQGNPVTKNTKEEWDISSSNRSFTLDIGPQKK
ncbi:MAG: carboxypeptidase-like regulatory domain-containing protein [Gemmataceae bacterium]|nr:carboxypeptidase-like regulatory domain-containing protein [Gemmataceae bacterium]